MYMMNSFGPKTGAHHNAEGCPAACTLRQGSKRSIGLNNSHSCSRTLGVSHATPASPACAYRHSHLGITTPANRDSRSSTKGWQLTPRVGAPGHSGTSLQGSTMLFRHFTHAPAIGLPSLSLTHSFVQPRRHLNCFNSASVAPGFVLSICGSTSHLPTLMLTHGMIG